MMPSEDDMRAINRFAKWHRENPRPLQTRNFERMRMSSYGIAGAAFLILVQLLSIQPLSGSLILTAIACGIALPCAIFSAVQMQTYISVGTRAYSHADRFFYSGSDWLASRGALVSLFVAVAGVLWHLSFTAFLLFMLTAFGFLWHSLYWYIHLARWWFEDDGPGSKQSERHDGTPPNA